MNTGAETWEIDPPIDVESETVVPYYKHAAEVFERLFGRAPSRNTLTMYIHTKPGYPVQRGGPYVRIPVITRLKRQYTTVEAFDRFIGVVNELEKELGLEDASQATKPKRRRPRVHQHS